MYTCDRCGESVDDLTCTGCAHPGHQHRPWGCPDDIDGLGDVCSRCWAILSHVEHMISCASGCECVDLHGDDIEA